MSVSSISGISNSDYSQYASQIKDADADGDGYLSSDEIENANFDSAIASYFTEGMSVSSAQSTVESGLKSQQSGQVSETQGKKLNITA